MTSWCFNSKLIQRSVGNYHCTTMAHINEGEECEYYSRLSGLWQSDRSYRRAKPCRVVGDVPTVNRTSNTSPQFLAQCSPFFFHGSGSPSSIQGWTNAPCIYRYRRHKTNIEAGITFDIYRHAVPSNKETTTMKPFSNLAGKLVATACW